MSSPCWRRLAGFETEIDLPEIFTFSPRQVAAKRKELLQVYEELAGRLTGEAADEVLLKIDKLRALMREKAARLGIGLVIF